MKQNSAVFANFICRFGDKVLLDYAKQIVLPAFTDDTLIRSYGETQYHFYEVKLVNLAKRGEEPILAVVGQFIKNTLLTRVQVFDESNGLIHDEQSMRSAPSAFFVLILNNHRLIYMPETPYAPDLVAFRGTALAFLRSKWNKLIDNLFEASKRNKEPITKVALRKLHPIPTLEVVPLTDRRSLAEFVKRYETLRRIDFRLITPNDEIDASDTLERVRKLGLGLDATITRVITENKDGLDKEASLAAVEEATATGNQEVILRGVDEAGNSLKVANDSFELSVPIGEIPNGTVAKAKFLFKKYIEQVDQQEINAPGMNNAIEKIRQLVGLF
ncbi:hypothetical protein [Rhizobium sp. Rhizsp42]|uniref:hypothetical protein n=1 Tax=Rhizobium sp. Rhizsp42 TaxID=3243034 RepID=UPI0039B0A651